MKGEADNMDEIASRVTGSIASSINGLAAPIVRTGINFLEGKQRRRNKSASKSHLELMGILPI